MATNFKQAEIEFVKARKHFVTAVKATYNELNNECLAVSSKLDKANDRLHLERRKLLRASERLAHQGTQVAKKQYQLAKKRFAGLEKDINVIKRQLEPIKKKLFDVNKQLRKTLGLDEAIKRIERRFGGKKTAKHITKKVPSRSKKKTTTKKKAVAKKKKVAKKRVAKKA